MAGWRNFTNKFGNDEFHYKAVIDGIVVESYIEDCDGDFIEWSVSDDGNLIASGSIGIDSDEVISFENVKKTAEMWITMHPFMRNDCYDINSFNKFLKSMEKVIVDNIYDDKFTGTW